MPDGSFTEGLHQCAWPYDLCLKIDQNRALLAQNISARPRKGNIHTFAGIAYCAHCKTPLTIHPSRAKAKPGQSHQTKVYSYIYYECDSIYRYGTPCKASGTKRWMSIRADILEYQFGVLLSWLGEWSDDVEAQLQALYLSEGVHDADPSEEYERRRQELSRRKDNVSRQHELGYLTDEQLAQRMAAIASEEAQLPIPLQRRCNTPQETLGLMRSLGTQWLEADRPQHRVLRYQLANALADRVYVDLDRLSIVGIQFKPDLYLPAQHMLWHRSWHEQTEHPNTLWNPQAQVPDGLPPTNTERVLAALRKGCTTSTEIVQESGVSPRNSVNVLLLRLLREGKVTRERIQREGKEYRYHLAEQTEQVEG